MNKVKTKFISIISIIIFTLSITSFPLTNATFQTDKVYELLQKQEIISDVENFRPEDICTRAEFYKMALSTTKVQIDESGSTPFKDVPINSWFSKYIKKGLEMGITEKGNFFYPNEQITKAEAIKILILAKSLSLPTNVKKEDLKFKDVNANSLFAKYVKAALDYGMFKNESSLKPNKLLTRLDAANLIYDFLTRGAGVIQQSNQGTQGVTITINAQNGISGSTAIEKQLLNSEKFKILLDVLNKIDAKYVDQSKINIDDLVYGAIKGMVEKLGDQYTVYQEPIKASSFTKSLTGEFDGVGLSLELQNEQIIVVAPIKKTPAEAAGIKSGDIITKVNHQSIKGKALDEVVQMIQGQAGTNVTLTILRSGIETDFNLKRQHIKINSVEYEMKSNIAYIEIISFTNNTPSEFQNALDNLMDKNPKGFVIDLRNNPGGFLNSAISLLNHFISKDKIVMKMVFADQGSIEYKSQGPGELSSYPVYVLINQGSASASEIMAAAIGEHGIGKLVGTASFGKGSVQELINYNDSSMLKITMAKWLTPSGKNLTKSNPLKPDYEVKYEKSGTYDPVLDAAISLINSK